MRLQDHYATSELERNPPHHALHQLAHQLAHQTGGRGYAGVGMQWAASLRCDSIHCANLLTMAPLSWAAFFAPIERNFFSKPGRPQCQ